MKTHPILFSTEMVQAISQGNKTQTRRTNGLEKFSPVSTTTEFKYRGIPDGLPNTHCFSREWNGNWVETLFAYCPYGQVGDVLWVRESFCFTRSLEYLHQETRMPFMYKADIKDVVTGREVMKDHGWKFKPSIHMPKAACRLFLEITSIRVERLQDITEEDAIAEGILVEEDGFMCWDYLKNDWGQVGFDPVSSFESLWSSVNGEESWNDNPWVWVIEFKRIDKPKDF